GVHRERRLGERRVVGPARGRGGGPGPPRGQRRTPGSDARQGRRDRVRRRPGEGVVVPRRPHRDGAVRWRHRGERRVRRTDVRRTPRVGVDAEERGVAPGSVRVGDHVPRRDGVDEQGPAWRDTGRGADARPARAEDARADIHRDARGERRAAGRRPVAEGDRMLVPPERDRHRPDGADLRAYGGKSAQVNILGALADGLYSNMSDVLDADSDLIETLLNQDDSNERVNLGMSIAARALSSASTPPTNQVQVAQELTGANETARINLLSELVLAVGFQRHRFVQRQQAGDVAVCRCLARTAARVLVGARGSLRTSPDDLLDLLFKAASHPSIYVSGIAIEALADCAAENPNLATRLLPVLQGKAIIQTPLLDDVGSLEDYINFRQRVLAIGFQGCYSGCEGFYLRSCASAIDEFCSASLSPQLPFQLEAALVCMISVSNKATKTSDKQALVSQLDKMVSALVANDFKTTSHPVVMASLCRFICKYAKCLTWCATSVYEAACELTLQVFQRDLAEYDTRWRVITQTSPLSLASDALKSLLCRNPDIFQSPDALSALERTWNLPYQTQKIPIEDRETLCSGLAVVIQSLPSDSQETSFTALAKPVLSCVAVLTKNIDEMTTGVDSILIRIGNEIRLLAKLVDVFHKSNREPVVVLVQRTWPAVVHISKAHFATNETLANSVGQYLLASLSLYRSEEDISLLRDIASLVKELMAAVADAKSSASLIPLLKFAGQLVKAKQLTNGAEDVTKEVVIATFESLRSGMDELVLATCTYDFLNALAKNSPALLLGLSNGDLVRSSIVDARRSLGAKETDVIRCSSNFLNSLAKSVVSSQQSQAVDAVKQNLASDVTMFTIELTCAGLAPRGGLADLTNLLLTILDVLRWSEIEHAVLAAMGSGKFQLGDEVTRVTITSLRDSTESACVSSNLSEMIDCLWAMHQQSETDGTIAGEELVQDFLQKYSSKHSDT
ncbi:hypothetical protein THAOC_11125, partial [Thalassiosira oceanica]